MDENIPISHYLGSILKTNLLTYFNRLIDLSSKHLSLIDFENIPIKHYLALILKTYLLSTTPDNILEWSTKKDRQKYT